MSDGEPNEKEGAYFSLLPELTLTCFDFEALSLREEDIAHLLSPSQHPLDYSPDFQDFADLAHHILSETDVITERRNSTGEWERELLGRAYQQPLSEDLTPDFCSPSQYPLDSADSSSRVCSVGASSPPGAGTREQSDGAQAESVMMQPSPQSSTTLAQPGNSNITYRQLNHSQPPLTSEASTSRGSAWHPDIRHLENMRDVFPSGAPRTTSTAGSSSDNSQPASSSSRRSIQVRRRAEGGHRRATSSASTVTNTPTQRDTDARLQRKRGSTSFSISDSARQTRVNFVTPGHGGGANSHFDYSTDGTTMVSLRNTNRREGPSDGFDAKLDNTPYAISGSETSSDERHHVSSVPITNTGTTTVDDAGYFFDQPRGEPMGSEGGMMVPTVPQLRNFVPGTNTDSSELASDNESIRGRTHDYAVRSLLSGEEGSGCSADSTNGLALRRTDWLRGTVEGADDAESVAAGPPIPATTAGSAQLPAWWQPNEQRLGGDADYLEGNVRPPLVGQSEENRGVTTGGGQPPTTDTFAHRSCTPESLTSECSEPGMSSSRASQPVSTSTMASKDSLAHRVNNMLQRGNDATVTTLQPPPAWLASDDDNDEVPVQVNSRIHRTRADYPLESVVRRQFLSACQRDAKVVSFGKGIGRDDSDEGEEEEESVESLGPRFAGGSEMDGVDSAKEGDEAEEDGPGYVGASDGDCNGGGYEIDINQGQLSPLAVSWQPSNQGSFPIPPNADQKEILARQTDELSLGLSLELADTEQCHLPAFVATTTTTTTTTAVTRMDTPVDHTQRATSPSVQSVCSVASSKRLEWDSGADIGYGGARVMYGLSTLERMAIGSTVFHRMEPEGKSNKDGNARAGTVVLLSGPTTDVATVEPTTGCTEDGCELCGGVSPADFSGLSHRQSRSSDQCLSPHLGAAITYVVEGQAHSPESGEMYPVVPVLQPTIADTPHRPKLPIVGQRSNSMMDLSHFTNLLATSPVLCADDRRHCSSTSDIKDGGSGGRLYKLINSWFSSTSGMSTSSGGTVVPVLGPTASPPNTQFGQHLCSTAIEGSGGSKSGHPRLSFHTPAIITTQPAELSPNLSRSHVTPDNCHNVVTPMQTPADVGHLQTFLTVSGQRNQNERSAGDPGAEKSTGPPPTRAEQEARLLAFAEKFVSSLCPSANPARRLKMAGRILGDIGALLRVPEPVANSSGKGSAKLSPLPIPHQPNKSVSINHQSSVDYQPIFANQQPRVSVSALKTESARQSEHHSINPDQTPILQTTITGVVTSVSSSATATTDRHHTSGKDIHPHNYVVAADNAGSSMQQLGLTTTVPITYRSPRVISRGMAASISMSSSAGDYYVGSKLVSDRLPLDGRATDSDACSSTVTSHQVLDTVTSNGSSSHVTPPHWYSSLDKVAGSSASTLGTTSDGGEKITPRRRRHDQKSQRAPEQRRGNRRDSNQQIEASDMTSSLSIRGSLSSLLGVGRTMGATSEVSPSAAASPESLRLLRELVQRQRRRYLKTLQKEVAWLEKMELMLGRRKGRSTSAKKERSPRKGGVVAATQVGLTRDHKRSPVKVTRDFGQSYPTPCPSDHHQSGIGRNDTRRRSASVGDSADNFAYRTDSAAVHSDEGGRQHYERPIVVVPTSVTCGGHPKPPLWMPKSAVPPVQVRKRASSATSRRGALDLPRSESGLPAMEPRTIDTRRTVSYFLPCPGGSSERQSRVDCVQPGRSLQDAFRQHRATTLERMEMRQCHLRAAAIRRGVPQPLSTAAPPTGTIVINLLDVQTRHRKYTVPHPLSGQHHRPCPRGFTQQQMKCQTERVFQDLPEVMGKLEMKRRESTRQSNRLMAQRFNKKLQEFALRGKVSLRHTQKCL